jgi:hypothetical protein
MKRRVVGAAASLLILLALAGPVAAWDSVAVTITGAGGTAIGGTSGAVIDSLLVGSAGPDRPAGELGPRFQIAFALDGRVVATEDLYPYAPAGPVAYLASAGELAGHPFAAGWHQAKPEVLQVFVGWGLPATATVGSAATDTSAATPTTGLMPVVALGIGVVLVLLGLALRTRIASGIGIRLGRRGLA